MNLIKSILAGCLMLALSCLAPPAAKAQVTPANLASPTNLPTLMTANATSNQVSFIALPKFGSLTVQAIFNTSTNVGAEAIGFRFVPSVDGTNLSTAVWYNMIGTANGFTNVVLTTNFARTLFEGYSYVSLAYITNGTAGTLTNKGVIFNRIYNSASQ